ncbi:glycoprotein-N-acetylgalactosamine 3-beta-galactosyltransferase 1-like [Littorina saxatilis]|uniref:N-acetylgalactosaminide beta-1,3-galactosyltransferase n=1 Tax=Littorina saxatilis TaxID=31220 RepID=A0AAN9ARS1_9CAEN
MNIINMRVNTKTLALMGAAFALALLLSSVYQTFFVTPLHHNMGISVEDSPSQKTSDTGRASSFETLDRHGSDAIVAVDESEARRLQKKVRVLVWVMTSPKSLDRARVVKSTWGTRADKDLFVFMSSEKDPSLPTVALAVKEGRDHLTAKTMQAFDYIYKHYFQKADFFMKADDDAYVIMENLRYFLSHLNPNEAFVTGRHFRHHVKQGFPSGGAGYVISKETLRRLALRSKDPPMCKEDGYLEDVELGRCLEKLGVPILNSTDSRGRSRFHPYTPMHHVVKGLGKNYEYWDANIVRVGPDAINEFPISFHYIKPDEMKLLHFFLYNIRPYGINHKFSTT